jgi:predicted RNA-binding Zn-ribbon protein involved in translation (DUF1610 family)
MKKSVIHKMAKGKTKGEKRLIKKNFLKKKQEIRVVSKPEKIKKHKIKVLSSPPCPKCGAQRWKTKTKGKRYECRKCGEIKNN